MLYLVEMFIVYFDVHNLHKFKRLNAVVERAQKKIFITHIYTFFVVNVIVDTVQFCFMNFTLLFDKH